MTDNPKQPPSPTVLTAWMAENLLHLCGATPMRENATAEQCQRWQDTERTLRAIASGEVVCVARSTVSCKKCGATVLSAAHEATAAWNRRAGSASGGAEAVAWTDADALRVFAGSHKFEGARITNQKVCSDDTPLYSHPAEPPKDLGTSRKNQQNSGPEAERGRAVTAAYERGWEAGFRAGKDAGT